LYCMRLGTLKILLCDSDYVNNLLCDSRYVNNCFV